MKDFGWRFAGSIGVMAFGVAGFASMMAGALVSTSLLRAAAAGAVFLALGRLVAVILFNGPMAVPRAILKPKRTKEEKQRG